jgi:hypothetical protein
MQLSLAKGEPVTAQDRADVLDALNRFNMAFDVWDLETIYALQTDDFKVHHPRGTASGSDELSKFYENYYPLTVGMRRHHMNHVVNGNADGTITVNSYNLLIRVASRAAANELRGKALMEGEPGLPAIATHSLMIDRFRRDPGHGWRLMERWVEETVVNREFL